MGLRSGGTGSDQTPPIRFDNHSKREPVGVSENGAHPPKGSFNRENDDLAMKLGVPNSQTNPYVDVPANTCICNACSLQSHFLTMHRSSNF